MSFLRQHWPEYLCEAIALALFMVSATTMATLLQHPASPLSALVSASALGRLPMGLAMGLTAIVIIYSPIGTRSGAHMNPAVTLAFLRLGKLHGGDAAGYVAAQIAGGIAGTAMALGLLAGLPADPSVNFIVTTPGPDGEAIAFAAEAAMSFVLLLTVLLISSQPGVARWTGVAAGLLVAVFITLEAPLSGMSMNPARTLGPVLFAWRFDAIWIYLTAPLVGTLAAAELFVRAQGSHRVRCAKLHHLIGVRCIFKCGHAPVLSENHA